MTRVITAAVLSAFLVVAAAPAQTPPAAPSPTPAPAAPAAAPVQFPSDAKIGYVDPQVVLQGSAAGKAGMTELQQLITKKQTEIQAKNKEIQTLQQEIKTNQSVWAAAVATQKQGDLTRLQNELQFMQTQAQTETDALEQRMLQEFQEKVIPIIEAVRQERNLFIIFTNGSGSVVALDPRIDLSNEVIRRLDASK